jgi:hypothetical protein
LPSFLDDTRHGNTVDAVPLSAPIQLSGLGPQASPDLVVTGLTVTSNGPVQSGSQVTVSLNDTNNGNQATAASWTDQLVVRNANNQVIANLSIPYDQTASGPLAAGASIARQKTVTLPDGVSGAGNLTFSVSVDALNTTARRS